MIGGGSVSTVDICRSCLWGVIASGCECGLFVFVFFWWFSSWMMKQWDVFRKPQLTSAGSDYVSARRKQFSLEECGSQRLHIWLFWTFLTSSTSFFTTDRLTFSISSHSSCGCVLLHQQTLHRPSDVFSSVVWPWAEPDHQVTWEFPQDFLKQVKRFKHVYYCLKEKSRNVTRKWLNLQNLVLDSSPDGGRPSWDSLKWTSVGTKTNKVTSKLSRTEY